MKMRCLVMLVLCFAAQLQGSNTLFEPANHREYVFIAQEQFNQQPPLSQVPQLRTLAADSALRHYDLKIVQRKTPSTIHPLFDALLEAQAAYVNTNLEKSKPIICYQKILYKNIANFLLCEALEHSRKPEILKPILTLKPDVNIFIGGYFSNRGDRPLHIMVRHKEYNGYLQLIINAGAHLNVQTTLDYTPLIEATHCQNIPAAKALVLAGANVAIQDHVQRTVLHHAMYPADVELVKLLLNANIDVQIKDRFDHTALDLVTIIIEDDHSLQRPAREVIRKLLKNKINQDQKKEQPKKCKVQ